MFAVRVTEIVELDESDPFQPTNPYPSLGVAVILKDVPSLYVPPYVETLQPSPAVTVKVYWVTEVVGLVVFVGGATYTDELSSALSFEQVISNNKLSVKNSFFTFKFINLK